MCMWKGPLYRVRRLCAWGGLLAVVWRPRGLVVRMAISSYFFSGGSPERGEGRGKGAWVSSLLVEKVRLLSGDGVCVSLRFSD